MPADSFFSRFINFADSFFKQLFKQPNDMNRILLLIVASLLMNTVAYARRTIYLSSEGSDSGRGTSESPYYSLNKAVEGRLGDGDATDTLFIEVAAGDYYMERPFVIDRPSSRPIVVRAADSSRKPRFIGGITVKGWEKFGDRLYRAQVPEVTHYGLDFEQLFVNGNRATLARTPNTDWYYVAKSSEISLVKGVRYADYATQRIDFNPDDWSDMKGKTTADLRHVKFRFYHKWDITHKRAAYIGTDSAFIYMTGHGMHPWNRIQNGSRYIMYDYMGALDVPGEWYLDRESGYLYYMPLDGEDMDTAEAFIPVLTHLVEFKGVADRPVKNVTFENISFRYSSYRVPEHGEEPMQAAAFTDAALSFDYSENINLLNCEIIHTGAYAVWFRRECHDNRIEHCYLADLGAGGIKIGEPCFRSDGRRVSSRNIIDNNIITHAGRELPCGTGVAIFHSSDNRVTHNEISDLYYSGVSVGWVWGYNDSSEIWTHHVNARGDSEFYQAKLTSPAVRNTVSYNHIHHIGWGELSDMGAVYTLGESEGTKVTNNVIHDVVSYDYGGWGLYTDEGSTGVEMTDNLVYRCKSGGFHQHYGQNNRIENNIFAFGHYHQVQYSLVEPHLSFHFKHNIILQEQGETLAGPWDEGMLDIDSNLYWHLDGTLRFANKYTFEEWKKLKEPHSVCADPMFVDVRSDDYTLRSTRVVGKVGFKPFDYTEAGVYGDSEWIERSRLSQQTLDDFRRRTAARLNR